MIFSHETHTVSRVMAHSKLLFMGLAAGLIATAAAVMATYAPAGAQAVSSQNNGAIEMTISPTKQQLSLQPNEQSEGTFSVLNTGDEQFTFKLYASPYFVANEQYDPVFNKESARTQISRWISVSEEEVTLQPGEIKEVQYAVQAPADVPSGGQYAVIFAETTDESSGEGSIIAKKRVGMLVYGTVAGDTRDGGEIASSDIGWWQQSAPVTANMRIKNTGNTDFEAITKMTVTSLFGKKVYESSEAENVILPDTTRSVDLTWDNASIGIYTVETTANFLDDTHAHKQLVLVISPLAALSIIVGIVLIVGGTIYAARKKRK